MDATEARTHHIRRLVEQAGGPVKFAEKVKGRWQPVQISQWTSEKNPKRIGRQIARELESILKLPEAFLDRPPTAPGSQPQRMDPLIVGKAAKAVTIFLKRRNPLAELDLGTDEDAELLSAVYQLFADPANLENGDLVLGGTIADLVAKREAVRDARRSGGRDEDGRVVGAEAGKALPDSEASATDSPAGAVGAKSRPRRHN